MLRYLADENFNGAIVSGLRRREPALDLVRVQDVGLAAAKDPAILAWAADERRLLLTHDASTMVRHAYDRVNAGLAMPGVIEVKRTVPIRVAIDDLLIMAAGSLEDEWEGQVLYLPLR